MKIVFGWLLALLKLSGTSIAADDDIESPDKPCRARAWVRAPDLDLGRVVQGDVKVKLDGACPEVLSYTLKLRFAERSWVKTRRQGVQLPEPPTDKSLAMGCPTNRSILEPDIWRDPFSRCPGMKQMDWDKYTNVLKDPSLWLIREEERIGFEAKYVLWDGKHTSHSVVEPFAILVPSTIYPPAFNPSSAYSVTYHELDVAGSEHIYAYVVDVAFSNGTIIEVPAGYTSFNAPTVTSTSTPETVNVTVTPPSNGYMSEVVKHEDVDNFILEVTFPHGRHFEQGSVNNITVVSYQVGPGIMRPYRVGWLIINVTPKQRWAASLAAENKTAEHLLDTKTGRHSVFQLRATNPLTQNSHFSFFGPRNEDLGSPKFSQDEAFQNGTLYRTKPVTVQFHVSESCYPNFDMNYQAIENELLILIGVRNASLSSDEDTEEYDWTPMVKESNLLQSPLYSASIPLFIHSRQDDPTKLATTENIHYLSPEARAPVFVDPESVQDLLRKSINERDALLPKAQPKFITREGSDVVKDRYFIWGQGMSEKYYVGDTWLRKVVLPRKKNEAERLVGRLRVQT